MSVDRLALAKGYIMRKMYLHDYTGGRHTAIENLPKGKPLELAPYMSEAIGRLKAEGLLRPKPASYGKQICAIKCEKGYVYANAYERHANLPVVDYMKPRGPKPSTPPLTPEQLRALKIPKRKSRQRSKT